MAKMTMENKVKKAKEKVEAEKKSIEIETPLGGVKIDTGDKRVDFIVYGLAIIALLAVAILKFG